jgi:lactoylglutathione lyase
VFENDDSAVFKIGSTLINLLQRNSADELVAPARVGSRDDGVRHVFSIEVEDVDLVCAELAARGVSLLNGPMDRPWGIRTASFQDPAGHTWEIAK